MKEKEVEQYFDWTVQVMGGKTWKFTSPSNRGVADRIACLPDGSTWFMELKKPGGRLSALQKEYAKTMVLLKQNYRVLWTKEQVDAWRASLS